MARAKKRADKSRAVRITVKRVDLIDKRGAHKGSLINISRSKLYKLLFRLGDQFEVETDVGALRADLVDFDRQHVQAVDEQAGIDGALIIRVFRITRHSCGG